MRRLGNHIFTGEPLCAGGPYPELVFLAVATGEGGGRSADMHYLTSVVLSTHLETA